MKKFSVFTALFTLIFIFSSLTAYAGQWVNVDTNTTKVWVDTSRYETRRVWVQSGYWDTKKVWVDTSHWETRKVWVDTSHWETRKVWVDTSHWETRKVWVDTSHWETRKVWVDTSHWEYRKIWVNSGYWKTEGVWVKSGHWEYKYLIPISFISFAGGTHQNVYIKWGRKWVDTSHWEYRKVWVDTSHWEIRKVWVKSGYWKTEKVWVESGYWKTEKVWVQSGYWKTERVWVDTSHWETQRVWVQDGYWAPVNATVTVSKSPTYIYTKWHVDENKVPASMTITITVSNLTMDKKPASVSKIEAYHVINRYEGKGQETIYPVSSSMSGSSATFKFEYPHAGDKNSLVNFLITVSNGTQTAKIRVYAPVPVNGFQTTGMVVDRDVTPQFDRSVLDSETISF